MSQRSILTLYFLTVLGLADAQDRRTGTIQYQQEGKGHRLSIEIPPPRTIPGAPKAFDEHLIEFGDGRHSFEAAPVHQFSPGRHTIRTSIINNYDDGKPPKIPPRIIEIDDSRADAGYSSGVSIPPVEPLMFLVFQDPMPDEEVVCIITYANTTNVTLSGKIDLYYNELLYGGGHFDFTEARLHHGETEIPPDLLSYEVAYPDDNTLASTDDINVALQDASIDRSALQQLFDEQRGWEFVDLRPEETRNLYVTLSASSAMLKDTNATIRLAATLESADGRIRSLKVEHKQIVTSHDPNRMTVRPRKADFRRRGGHPLEYFVKFQNHGEGPARQIYVQCALPDGMDLHTLRILDMYPPCPMCPDGDVTYGCLDTTWQEGGVLFTFRNVYLPGRAQDLTRRDSTKGFVRFDVRPGEKVKKVPFVARSEIIFDQNAPIRTNAARMRYRADYRTGLIAGAYQRRAQVTTPSYLGFFAGTIFTPYRPYRFFYQAEVMPVFEQFTVLDAMTGEESFDLRQWHLDIVPLQIRKNLTSFAGLGAGLHVSTQVYSQRIINGVTEDPLWLQEITPTVFADLNIGMVRSGISGGIRYHAPLDNQSRGYWGLYLMLRP